MIKALIIAGMFLLLLSAGLVIKDWDYTEDVKLLSDDDVEENIRNDTVKFDEPTRKEKVNKLINNVKDNAGEQTGRITFSPN